MLISAAVKKAIRYSVVQNILKHYECPVTCGAHCCIEGQIHMFEDELEVLSAYDRVKAGKITREGQAPGLYRMKAPCPFLNEAGRCEVYAKRPTVCGMYPFKVNASGNSVGLQPCPVGFLIIRDFAAWIIDSVSKSKLPGEDRAGIIDEWQKNVESYAAELAEFHTKPVLKEMQIPFDELEMLSIFLDSRKQ